MCVHVSDGALGGQMYKVCLELVLHGVVSLWIWVPGTIY